MIEANYHAAGIIQRAARAALEARGADAETISAVLADLTVRCRHLPQYDPKVPPLPSMSLIGKRARIAFTEKVAGAVIADTARYVGDLTEFYIAQIVDLAVDARRARG